MVAARHGQAITFAAELRMSVLSSTDGMSHSTKNTTTPTAMIWQAARASVRTWAVWRRGTEVEEPRQAPHAVRQVV